jgi:hypothetical protein
VKCGGIHVIRGVLGSSGATENPYYTVVRGCVRQSWPEIKIRSAKGDRNGILDDDVILAWRGFSGLKETVSPCLCQWRSAQRRHQVQGERLIIAGTLGCGCDSKGNFPLRDNFSVDCERMVAKRAKIPEFTYRGPLQVNRVAHLSIHALHLWWRECATGNRSVRQ